MTPQLVGGIVAAVLVFWAVGAYNRLVRLRNRIAGAFAQVDAQLKRRYELIPELVDFVRMHSPADQERLEAVMAACHQAKAAADLARARPISAGAMTSLSMAEQVLGSALGKLAALIDAETKLKGEPRLRELTDLLANTDGQLAFSRQLFNDAARTYNEAAHQLPTRLLSNLFGFRRAAMLQVAASDAERANSRVQ